MGIVHGRMYDYQGNPKNIGWGFKLMFKENGLWRNEATLCVLNETGYYASHIGSQWQPAYSITPNAYNPKVVYPNWQPTSPEHACWAESPQPLYVIDGMVWRDVVCGCEDLQLRGGGLHSVDLERLFTFDYLPDDSLMADQDSLEADLEEIEKAGYQIAARDAKGAVLQIQSRATSKPPVFRRTGLRAYPLYLPDPWDEEMERKQ